MPGRNQSKTTPEASLAADRAEALTLCPVSRETERRLEILVELLLKWQKTTNLVASSTLRHVWTRHVADSLQLLAQAPDAKVWIDLGSGAGFPGLVLACALAERPGAVIHLIESNAKKAAFLREVARATGAPAIIHNQRIEEFAASFEGYADIVTARALAPLDRLLDLAEPLMRKGAVALFLKGQDVESELTEASKCWSIQVQLLPSQTDAEGCVLIVRHADRRADSASAAKK